MSTSGICPCGGWLKDHEHTVKTHLAAVQWDREIREADLPVSIERKVCSACGRDEVIRVHKNVDNETQLTFRL